MANVTVERTNNKTVIRKKEGVPFRILQLTDVHIGGGFLSVKKDRLALDAVEKLVRASNADFVVVTGDICYPLFWFSGTSNNERPSKRFADLMKKLGVPWCVTFGNHDSEKFAKLSREELGSFYESQPNCYFEKGDSKLTGCGNYCIRLENADGKLNTLLMMLDSNAYVGKTFFSGFDVIHEDQIQWYEDVVYEESVGGELARSLAFFHIPPKEFKDAWEKCYRGDKDVVYRHGFVQEKDNYFGYPKTVEGTFFGEMVKFGSCKGMFMGHDHLNTLSLTYKGIRLTYGMSIDYLAYYKIAKKHTQRGGTIIEIADDGSFDVKLLPLDDITKQ